MNALLFAGFAVASLTGVMLNNTVVPMLGWGAIFQVLGCMSLVALIMLICFHTEKTTFIPFDDERPFFERKLSQMQEGMHRSKRRSQYKSEGSKVSSDRSAESDVSSQDNNSRTAGLLAGQRYE